MKSTSIKLEYYVACFQRASKGFSALCHRMGSVSCPVRRLGIPWSVAWYRHGLEVASLYRWRNGLLPWVSVLLDVQRSPCLLRFTSSSHNFFA